MKGKRRLSDTVIRKRGCTDCLHIIGEIHCEFSKCPYHELDKYRSYDEYLEETKSRTIILL